MAYNGSKNYQAEINAAIARGDYKTAARLEQSRNEKITSEGITDYAPTNKYTGWLDDTDYTTILKDQMAGGASADEVSSVLGKRVDKAAGTEGLSQYAYDDVYRTAMEYIQGKEGGGKADFEGFSYENAPSYTSKYQDKIDALYQSIMDRPSFSYDPARDPLYGQYAQTYAREGQRAMQDTVGEVSARTGGLASSYAATAGAQANNNYMAQLSDKIPELQQLAYSMYMDEGNQQRGNLDMLSALEAGDYNQHLNQLGQYNRDREFQYGVHSDQWNRDYAQGRDAVEGWRYADGTAYDREQDRLDREENAAGTAYQKEQDALSWSYQRDKDAYNSAMDRWQVAGTLDEAGAKTLGLPVGTPTADERYQMARTVGGSGGGAAGRASGGGSGGEEPDGGEMDIYGALYDGGVRSEGEAYAHLLSQGYSSTEAGKLSGYYAAWVAAQPEQEPGWEDIDMDSVSALGYGPLSRSALDDLVQQGEVEAYEDYATGTIRFRKAGGGGRQIQSPMTGGPYLG